MNTQINTIEEVREFFSVLVAKGIIFHPDDDLGSDDLNETMDKCFEVCEANGADIYGMALDAVEVALPC